MNKVEKKKDVMVDLNLTLSFKVDNEQQAHIQLDENMIQQVLVTLLSENGQALIPDRVHDFNIEILDIE